MVYQFSHCKFLHVHVFFVDFFLILDSRLAIFFFFFFFFFFFEKLSSWLSACCVLVLWCCYFKTVLLSLLCLGTEGVK